MSDVTYTDASTISNMAKSIEDEPKKSITTVPPSNAEVNLPGGFLKDDGSLVKYAEVRELTGLDEEAISKAGSVGRALSAMLQRGLVSIGQEPVSKNDLDKLLSGDRDAILLGIRRVTFGDVVEYSFPCPECRELLDVTVNLNTDIPVSELEDPINDRVFNYVSPSKGVIELELPTGSTQKKLIENSEKTMAELNTILLASCIRSINGIPSTGLTSALTLGMSDREKLISEILKRNPGPRLSEVSTTCEACGEGIPLPMSLSDLFRL
jgi:hypothetical protein